MHPYPPVTASAPYHVSYPGHPFDPYGMPFGSPYGGHAGGGPMHIHYHQGKPPGQQGND